MISEILATDMANHGKVMGVVKAKLPNENTENNEEKNNEEKNNENNENKEIKSLVLEELLKKKQLFLLC